MHSVETTRPGLRARPFVVGGGAGSVQPMAGSADAADSDRAAPGVPGRGAPGHPPPGTAYAGAPAPGPGSPPSAGRGIELGRVRAAVEAHHRDLDGAERVTFDGFPDPGAPSAVLVALFEADGEARVVLTRRAAHLRTHTGEVSFPGGRLDAGETPEAGALREAAEEVGLDPGAVEVVGRLTPLVDLLLERPHHARWWALLPAPPPPGRQPPRGGARLRRVPRRAGRPTACSARSAGSCRAGAMPVADAGEDGSFPVWFFELPHDTVWGATARMLVELLRLVLDV